MDDLLYSTDKIGFAAYLCLRNVKLVDVRVKNRNRAIFVFELTEDESNQHELDYNNSDFSRYYNAFKLLRERTLKGAKDVGQT